MSLCNVDHSESLEVIVHDFLQARSLREQRANITLERLKYLDDGTTKVEGADQLINEYLKLADKSKSVDDMVRLVLIRTGTSHGKSGHRFRR